MNAPLVSILIPNYNYASYLPFTIQAILDQTYTNYEVIIGDDASTDQSYQVIQSFAEKDPRIHFFKNDKNRGVAFTINYALKMSKGEYVVSQSSDDLTLPTYLEQHLTYLQNTPAALSCSKYAYFYGDDTKNYRSLDLLKLDHPLYAPPKKVMSLIRKKRFWIPGNTVLMRRKNVMDAGGFDEKFSCHLDWFLFTKLALEHGMVYIPQTLALMRKHSNAMSTTTPIETKQKAWQEMIDELKKADHKKLKNRFLKSHAFYGFGLDFFDFMLKSPNNRTFFKHHLWLRFFAKWCNQKLKIRNL